MDDYDGSAGVHGSLARGAVPIHGESGGSANQEVCDDQEGGSGRVCVIANDALSVPTWYLDVFRCLIFFLSLLIFYLM